jgi:DNA-binding TFAR19-related protein (PDSD5 family)
LVKPDKARGVEDVLLRAAQTGGISEKVINTKHVPCFVLID